MRHLMALSMIAVLGAVGCGGSELEVEEVAGASEADAEEAEQALCTASQRSRCAQKNTGDITSVSEVCLLNRATVKTTQTYYSLNSRCVCVGKPKTTYTTLQVCALGCVVYKDGAMCRG